ncbi:unnamed protein product [Prorocentrum cordatum]|uniref:Nuclear nucleic acid-binding protein C1D n=1 Tax=Prorocentrum cordatum TaxID=2364126 RepID=A0ABN9Y644_9DINO|nr:unnamed protein product [Polarella glacialis]
MLLLASDTQAKVSACRASLGVVDAQLGQVLGKPLAEVAKKLAPLESAELQVGLAYAAASLYFSHLQTGGTDPASHPIRQEIRIDRIQVYFKKVRSARDELAARQAAATRLRVDAEAARRMVQHVAIAAGAVSQRRAAAAAAASAPAASAVEALRAVAASEAAPAPSAGGGPAAPASGRRKRRRPAPTAEPPQEVPRRPRKKAKAKARKRARP